MSLVEKWMVGLGVLVVAGVVALLLITEAEFDRDCLRYHSKRQWTGKMMATVRICDEWRSGQ